MKVKDIKLFYNFQIENNILKSSYLSHDKNLIDLSFEKNNAFKNVDILKEKYIEKQLLFFKKCYFYSLRKQLIFYISIFKNLLFLYL